MAGYIKLEVGGRGGWEKTGREGEVDVLFLLERGCKEEVEERRGDP